MAKPMKLREVQRALLRQDCWIKAQGGRHTKWACPCGKHSANIPRHSPVSPGVIDDTITRMQCLPKGWLQ